MIVLLVILGWLICVTAVYFLFRYVDYRTSRRLPEDQR